MRELRWPVRPVCRLHGPFFSYAIIYRLCLLMLSFRSTLKALQGFVDTGRDPL